MNIWLEKFSDKFTFRLMFYFLIENWKMCRKSLTRFRIPLRDLTWFNLDTRVPFSALK